jgi:hypothetical protein
MRSGSGQNSRAHADKGNWANPFSGGLVGGKNAIDAFVPTAAKHSKKKQFSIDYPNYGLSDEQVVPVAAYIQV